MEDELPQQQIEVMLEIHSKRILKEIAAVKEELLGKIAAVEEAVKKIRYEAPKPEPQQVSGQFDAASVPQKKPAEGPVAHAVQSTTATGEPVDRNGVAPESVSIEKIFYVGNK